MVVVHVVLQASKAAEAAVLVAVVMNPRDAVLACVLVVLAYLE